MSKSLPPVHPLVAQLHFTRSEFKRALKGVSDEDARRRFEPMNCISWIVAHMAYQEQRFWVKTPQGKVVAPELNDLAGYGKPATTPPLDEMWQAWYAVTEAANDYLKTISNDMLTTHIISKGRQSPETIGTMLHRNIYHYWYHLGESQAIRQLLGHEKLGQFVGNIGAEAPYQPETILEG
jgi:hypothetical protein